MRSGQSRTCHKEKLRQCDRGLRALRDIRSWMGSSETSQLGKECVAFVTILHSPTKPIMYNSSCQGMECTFGRGHFLWLRTIIRDISNKHSLKLGKWLL